MNQKTTNDSSKVIIIAAVVGVLMCGCIGMPVVAALAMLGYGLASSSDMETNTELVGPNTDNLVQPIIDESTITPDFGGGGFGGPPSEVGGGGFGGSNKEALRQQMAAAEAQLLAAQAQYEAAQAVYEQQRNFANSQGGRLGAQGISLPPPQQPDPQLYQNVLAAQAQYDQAKAAYDAAQ